MHGCLSTNEFRKIHHLTTNTYGHSCGADVENDNHTFRDCSSAMFVWLSLCPSQPSVFYIHDCKSWSKQNVTPIVRPLFIVNEEVL